MTLPLGAMLTPSEAMLTPSEVMLPLGAMLTPSEVMLTHVAVMLPSVTMMTPSVAPNRSICDYQTIDLPCVFLNIFSHFYIFYTLSSEFSFYTSRPKYILYKHNIYFHKHYILTHSHTFSHKTYI
jgi:hypothetical protein